MAIIRIYNYFKSNGKTFMLSFYDSVEAYLISGWFAAFKCGLVPS